MTLSESMETLRRELASLRETIEKSAGGERDLYSAEEVARRLSISPSTVRVLIARGELRYVRIGSRVRVPRGSIERFCRANHYEVWGEKDPETGRTRRPARMRPEAGGVVDADMAAGESGGAASRKRSNVRGAGWAAGGQTTGPERGQEGFRVRPERPMERPVSPAGESGGAVMNPRH